MTAVDPLDLHPPHHVRYMDYGIGLDTVQSRVLEGENSFVFFFSNSYIIPLSFLLIHPSPPVLSYLILPEGHGTGTRLNG